MTQTQLNTALCPVPNTEKDFYNWAERRQQKAALVGTGTYDLIFIGDSITHMFEIEGRGAAVWQQYYGERRALDLGYGWDCTQNVLWRLQHGEFASQQPKLVVLNIGTNNLTGNSTARANTAEEIVAGIEAICRFIQDASPTTTILVMAVFPRGLTSEPIHTQVQELNKTLAAHMAGRPRMLLLDIGDRFIGLDGEIPTDLMDDRTHPTEAGYRIWAEAIEPVVAQYL